MASEANKEKRDNERVPRPENHGWRLDVDEGLLVTQNIINVSQKGLSFKAPNWLTFTEGQPLKLKVTLGAQKSVHVCDGTIRWVKSFPKRKGAMQRLGVEIASPSKEFHETYLSLLDQQHKSLHKKHKTRQADKIIKTHLRNQVFMTVLRAFIFITAIALVGLAVQLSNSLPLK